LHSATVEKTTQPPLAFISNCSLSSSKSISLCLSSSYNDYNVVDEDESQHVFHGDGTFAIVILLDQVAFMKKLLWELHDKEEEFNPKMAALGERTTHL
jgi:hypothetical protein